MRLFDLHCDTITAGNRQTGELVPLRENHQHICLEKARTFGGWVQCFAVFIPDSCRGADAVAYFRRYADHFARQMAENKDLILPCAAPGDLDKAESAGKFGGVLTVEGAAGLGGDLSNLEDWARRGVRMCTLTWNGENELGRGVRAPGTGGLTAFGKEAVSKMEELGIVVDISHASPELFWDVARMAKKPFAASHSNAKALCGHPRNLTDEQFIAISESGGLVGLNDCPAFLRDGPDKAEMDDLLRHAEHFLKLPGGERVLAIGGDLDGTDLPGDMQDGLSAMPRVYERFAGAFGKELADRIFYDNAARFFRENGLL